MNIERRDIILSALAASLAGCGGAQGKFQTLDEYLDELIKSGLLVGLVMLVAQNGKIIFQKTNGYKDLAKQTPIGLYDNFRYSSLSKVFTHVAILRLFEMGKLRFEQNIRDFLPDFAPKLADGTTPNITISQLLTHSAGLDYSFYQNDSSNYRKAGISDGIDSLNPSLDENLRRISAQPLSFPPGQKWKYSVSSDVLGAIIEKITDQKLDAAIETIINQPLGLKSPTFHAAPGSMGDVYKDGILMPEKINNIATIKRDNIQIEFDTNRIYRKDAFLSGGAGMGGNAPDFLKLLEAIRGGDFLQQSTRNIAKQAILGENAAYFDDGWGFGYLFSTLINPAKSGFGFGKNTINWGGVYGHTWLIDFEHNLSFALLSNTAMGTSSNSFKQSLFSIISRNYT